MEAEQVHGRYTWFTPTQHDVGVHSHQVTIAQHVLNSELLARELDVILDHRLFQRRKTCLTVGIVVIALQVDVLLVSFIVGLGKKTKLTVQADVVKSTPAAERALASSD
jgi:hypothetical protein